MIYIIRHGKTDFNKANILQGRSDYPLNEEGIKQAKETAEMLKGVKFDHVFSSPLIRAIQTAELIAPDNMIKVDRRLIEMDYGRYEGTDLNNMPVELKIFFSDFINNPTLEGMEPLQDVVKRTGEFLEETKTIEGNILISTHAIAMKGILEYLTPLSKGSYWAKYIGNCAVYIAEKTDQHISIPTELKTKGATK